MTDIVGPITTINTYEFAVRMAWTCHEFFFRLCSVRDDEETSINNSNSPAAAFFIQFPLYPLPFTLPR